MKLKGILNKLPLVEVIGENLFQEVESASSDSRLIFPKSIFIVRKGENFNSLDFIPQIRDKVNCFLVPTEYREVVLNYSNKYKDKVFILTKDLPLVMEVISRELFKGIDKLNIIGITGTNGKTTISFLIKKILQEQGFACGVLGTVYYAWKDKKYSSFLTTLDNFMLKAILNRMYKDEVKYVVLEVSSHGLALGRVKDLTLLRAIFTNLSRDHLDFHKTMDNYFKAKFKIFRLLKRGGVAVVNVDDNYGFLAYKKLRCRKLSFSLERDSFYKPLAFRFEKGRAEFLINLRGKELFVKTSLIGRFNLYNVLAGLGCADSLGLNIPKTLESISSFKGVRGRMEEVRKGVFIDYAHTPIALREALLSLREAKFKKIILVFGCGGQRDRTKRPKMGRIASLYSDYSFITSDNPRAENPLKICKQIERGFTNRNYEIILDRREAIKRALKMKSSQDAAVLIAGKGHETFQIFKDKKVRFIDQKVVEDCLKQC
ncbi:MAG: UDP-N-acetylmuramoyl-L-alanyl-D-glutamate--2,6-diaminopimelate ligase [Candidatus Duberdicusella sinuisediminis]|nr:MAG: UDP-N-acetylmuramoyl-L-alanyl-D-glutamate--2,6-diaminopimelate ligase [Candidatus Omnitrophota bacterium]